MAASKTLLLLLASLAIANAISNIVVDAPNGQIYVTDGDTLYEIDNMYLEQNAVHKTNGSAGSLFIGKRSNNNRVLYSRLSTEETDNIVYFPLPLRNQATLVPAKSTPINSPRVPLAGRDNVKIFGDGRNLTLVDLDSFTIMDSIYYWSGSRKVGRNIVYNRLNKHVIVLYTRVKIGAEYGLSINEFNVENGTLTAVDTTYNCLCREGYNSTASPFLRVILESCAIDYQADSARIWCADPRLRNLFNFNAANLTDFRITPTGAAFDYVAWDFKGKFAYGIYGYINSGIDTTGFSVSKIRLSDGQAVATYTNTVMNIDPDTFELDLSEPHLYIEVRGETPKIISLNTNDMATLTEIALTL